MAATKISKTGNRTTLAPSVAKFLKDDPDLHLGGDVDFHRERQHHTQIFGFHALPKDKRAPIRRVVWDGVRGPHGSVPIRLFYPQSADVKIPALVYMHGGGYTVGSVDEFENGLRLIAEAAGVTTIGVEYHLAPEHHFPVQLDDYDFVIDWAQGKEGEAAGIDTKFVFGGGDSAGGNMTEAISLRRRDQGKKNLACQILLYPESRVPFDTPAAVENNSGLYLECNEIFSFAYNYLPKAPGKTYPPSYEYISPGMQSVDYLKNQPPVALFTFGFDPLRDFGVEYGSKLQEAGVQVAWHHYPELTHGFLQFAPWSSEAMKATLDVAKELRNMIDHVSQSR